MAAFIRKNLTFLIFKHASNKNVRFCISPLSLSLPLQFFSTRTRTHLDINPRVYEILLKHDFPSEFSLRIASELPRVRNPETADSLLSFLKSSGFSIAQLQKILQYRPTFLCCSLEHNIKPKIKSFEDEGFSSADISSILSRYPSILSMSLDNNIIPSLSVLKDSLGSNAAVIRVVRKAPRILNSNLQTTLVPNVEFLRSCGLCSDRIRIILHFGAIVAYAKKPEAMRASAEKAIEMGLSVSSKAFVYAIQTIGSTSNEGWELKLQAFRDVGFSESDILCMFRKDPRAFGVSSEKMKRIVEGLVATGKFGMSDIVHYPTSLTYSFEKRYKPRIAVLRILESRNLIENWPSLRAVSYVSEAEFSERFVRPYRNEVSDANMEEIRGC